MFVRKVAIIACFFIMVGCQFADHNSIIIKGKSLPIYPPADLSVESFIADYDTIRLEALSHSLMSGILQIHIMNDKLYIMDNSMCFIFIYSMQGHYLAKIANQGEGPKEYIKIGSFETDPVNNRILLTDSFSKRLFEYDENGILLRVVPLDFTPICIASDISQRFIHIHSGSQMFDAPQMEDNNIHVINSEGEITASFLKNETPLSINIQSVCGTSHTPDGELLYMPILSNTIYKISGTEAIAEYTLFNQTGRKLLTDKEKRQIFYTYDHNNLEKYEQEGYLISCGDFLYADSLLFLGLGFNHPLYTYYSLSDSNCVSIDPYRLQGNKGLCEIFSAHPKAIAHNSFYISISPEKRDYVLPLLPKGKMKTFLENMTEEDNPCVIAYRLSPKAFTATTKE